MSNEFILLKRIAQYSLPRYFIAIVFVSLLTMQQAFPQNGLSRISKVERSDGLGVVVRYHFEEAVDSFLVLQPAPDLVQMVLYGNNIDTTGIDFPAEGEKIKEVRLYDLGYGYGVDIYLGDDISYKASAYPDQNMRHLLVGLTKTPYEELDAYSQQFLARNWYAEINPDGALETEPVQLPVDNSYETIKQKLRFDTVIIDAGHGGRDPGTIGYRRTEEKDIVLKISKKLGNYLEELIPGMKVIYTREDDTYKYLDERGHIANIAEGDLFVSIHCNSWEDKRVRGTEVYFLGLHRSDAAFEVMKRENSVFKEEGRENLTEEDLILYELAHSSYLATSERIATLIDKQFKERAGRKSRGVKQAGFQVLYEASMPAVLVEAGFISNPSEQRFLTSDYGQTIIASAIFRAIRDYKVEYERGLLLGTNSSGE